MMTTRMTAALAGLALAVLVGMGGGPGYFGSGHDAGQRPAVQVR